ncbi:TPR end-of-group domain-containing protein [Parasphingorhabdus sp.]|uniref:TPR end-of-group domain-containing protein n=1 Tax=Parasphingorhabdus sp. TaxID=2709688 RepID=UPI003A935FDD
MRFFLLLLTLPILSAQTTPAPPETAPAGPVSQEEVAQLTSELEAEKEQRRSAEFSKEVAEAKTDILKAGNSRLENWIGLYGLLIAVIAIFAGWFTRSEAKEAQKQATAAASAAGEEATKAAKLEMLEFRDQAQTVLGEIRKDHATVRTLTTDLQERVNALPGDSSNEEPDAKEKFELKEAVELVKAKPEREWSAQEFRLLLYDAESNAKSDEDWEEYVRLAQGMAFLHGADEGDRAFALFAKAYGNAKLGKFETASLHYQEYLSQCPKDDTETRSGALVNWGNALDEQAQSKEGAEADALWSSAYEKYAEALKVKPDMHEALNNWGSALDEQARSKEGAEADALWSSAYEKYAEALKIKPDMQEALFNWGSVLAAQARSKEGAEADALWSSAYEKYAEALQVKPDKHEALFNWGNALAAQAESKEGAEADALWSSACEKYAEALKVKPDKHEALFNWGSALAAQAQSKAGAEADALWSSACEKYAEALQVKPDMHEALNNWGIALAAQAESKEGAEADALWSSACEKYAEALKVKPDKHEALFNWGSALAAQAQSKAGAEADALWSSAYEKYAEALQIKPDMHEALKNWGAELIAQAHREKGKKRSTFLDEAYDLLTRTNELLAGSGSYNLACIEAMRGDAANAAKWLINCKNTGYLPDCDHIMKDKDFDKIRETSEFKQVMEEIGCQC